MFINDSNANLEIAVIRTIHASNHLKHAATCLKEIGVESSVAIPAIENASKQLHEIANGTRDFNEVAGIIGSIAPAFKMLRVMGIKTNAIDHYDDAIADVQTAIKYVKYAYAA